MRKIILRLSVFIVVLGAAWGGYRLVQQLPQRQQQIPTATVRQGDVIMRAYTRGELRAVRSVTLTAPNLRGTVQVTKLAPLGSFAREKDLIVDFDDSEVLARLEEKQLELEQTDEQINKAQAELAIRNNQDQVELLRTRYSVRRAELEVKRNELLSEIDARKNLLNLDEAQRRLKQLENDIKSRQQQAEAELAVLQQERNKALIELSQEKLRLSQTRLLSPIGGLVAIHQNRFTGGRMFGMQVPDIREGDEVRTGMPIADVLDLSELEIVAKIGELDRANLLEGQDATIRLDALADTGLRGEIKSMSGSASRNIFSGDPSKKFDVVFSIDMRELLSAVGANPGQIRKVMETAARNRSKPQAQMPRVSFSMGGPPGAEFGQMGAGRPSGAQGFERAEGPAMPGRGSADEVRGGRAGEGRSRGSRGRGGRQMSQQDRQKMREALQKELGGRNIQDLSQEERRKIFTKIREKLQPSGAGPRAGGPGESGGARPAPRPQGETGGRMSTGRLPGGTGSPAAGLGGAMQFSEKELAEAKLPPPPEEDSQLEVLLRPGLLADVEIIVEKIPNAIYIPTQAVFEKDGEPVVFVKSGRRFEERSVKLLKRSESTMVVSEGLRPGELVALSDPSAREREKKQEQESGTGANPMGTAPAAGGN